MALARSFKVADGCASRPGRPRLGRRPLRVSAILSGPPPTRHDHQQQASPLSSSIPPAPAAARDLVIVKADAGAAEVPLEPEPQQPPAINLNVLNRVLDAAVLAPTRAYTTALKTKPLLTKAATSLVGFALGDLIAQHFSHHGAVDVLRVLRLSAYGFLIDGPIGSVWYDLLEKYVPGTSTKAVISKTALDQVVYATIMTAVYFALIRTMEGQPDLIWATLQAKFVPTLAANYAIWPLAHLINFKFVPADYRILYNNVVCVAWLTYLSLLTHTKINLLAMLHLTH